MGKKFIALFTIANWVSAFVIIIAFFFLEGCRQQAGKKDIIIVEGRIEKMADNKIFLFSYPDTESVYLEKKTVTDTANLDSDGNFSFEVKSIKPITFNIENSDSAIANNLFACPGDILRIDFKGSDLNVEIDQSNPAGKFNAFLVSYLFTFYHEPTMKQEYYIGTNFMDGHHFLIYNQHREKSQIDFMNNYFHGDSVRAEYRDYALNTIRYGIYVDRLMYVWKKRMKSEHVELDSGFFDFEKKEIIENPGAFHVPSYIRFLNMYIKNKYEYAVEQGAYPLKHDVIINPLVEKYKLAVKLLSRPYRDAVVYNIIQSDINNLLSSEVKQIQKGISIDTLEANFKKKYSLE